MRKKSFHFYFINLFVGSPINQHICLFILVCIYLPFQLSYYTVFLFKCFFYYHFFLHYQLIIIVFFTIFLAKQSEVCQPQSNELSLLRYDLEWRIRFWCGCFRSNQSYTLTRRNCRLREKHWEFLKTHILTPTPTRLWRPKRALGSFAWSTTYTAPCSG